MKRLLRIARELFVDGYKVVGLAAPLLSLIFTAVKAADVSINLRHISYAWPLLPLLIWVLVAYVRRLLRYIELESLRKETLANLGRLRAVGVALRNRSVSSQQEMDAWNAEYTSWLKEVHEAAGAVSRPLRDRLETLDVVNPGPKLPTPGFTIEHTNSRNIISEVTKRIGEYLEKNQ